MSITHFFQCKHLVAYVYIYVFSHLCTCILHIICLNMFIVCTVCPFWLVRILWLANYSTVENYNQRHISIYQSVCITLFLYTYICTCVDPWYTDAFVERLHSLSLFTSLSTMVSQHSNYGKWKNINKYTWPIYICNFIYKNMYIPICICICVCVYICTELWFMDPWIHCLGSVPFMTSLYTTVVKTG